jgi:hypothetical protein
MKLDDVQKARQAFSDVVGKYRHANAKFIINSREVDGTWFFEGEPGDLVIGIQTMTAANGAHFYSSDPLSEERKVQFRIGALKGITVVNDFGKEAVYP